MTSRRASRRRQTASPRPAPHGRPRPSTPPGSPGPSSPPGAQQQREAHGRHARAIDELLHAAARVPAGPTRDQLLAALAVVAAHERHWEAAELLHVTRRRTDPATTGILVAGLIATRARRPSANRAQDEEVIDGGTATGVSGATLAHAVKLLALLAALPALPVTADPDPASATPVDPRMAVLLQRVRGLLRKAESTTFDAEAESLTAKAQELITRHALDEAVLRTGPTAGGGGQPQLRRILLDDPYLRSKGGIVAVVALTNRCRAALSPAFGWVNVVGHPADLALTQLLTVSLLTQATAALARTGSRRDGAGRVRTRSYRRAFLDGFADRIHQRLREASAHVVAEVGADSPGALVLATREVEVVAAVDRLLGPTRRMRVRAVDPAGYTAGKAAADLASLDLAAGRLTPRA